MRRRWEHSSVIFIALSVALLGMQTGCGGDDKSSAPTGPSGGTAGQFLITGTFGTALVQGGAIEVFVTRVLATDPPATDAIASINGASIPKRALLSTAETATYILDDFNYTTGVSYAVTVTLGDKTATCSFTAPASEYPTITAPADDALFTPGSPIDVRWNYGGAVPDKVYVGAAPVSEDDGSYYDQELAGSDTSSQISATETATWTDQEVIVTVDLGEKAWPFTGTLALTGSGMLAVLPGDAISIRNSQGQPGAIFAMQAVIYPVNLAADGASTAELTVSIFDTLTSEPCPDGTALSVVVEPSGLASAAPLEPETSGGTCSIAITSGRSTGNVRFTIRAPGLDASLQAEALLSLVPPESGDTQIIVGSGTHPTISWSPAEEMASLTIAQAPLGQEQAAWSMVRRAVGGSWITPPVTYGTAPSGCAQLLPPAGNAPALAPGTSYRIWLVTKLGAVYTDTFTP